MANAANISEKLQSGLEPYVKSREQVNYIRRILAVQLAECTNDGSARSPLALAASSGEPGTNEKCVSGLYKEYLDELRKNSIAQKEFDAVQQDIRERPVFEHASRGTEDAAAPLQERVALLKLHRKRDTLYAVQETLDSLSERDPASTGFLDQERLFQGTPRLPTIPKNVTNSMVTEQNSSAPDIQSQVNQLEKIVLRAKLQLRQEEQLLREAKSQSNRISQPVREATKLDALNTTRDELINWIETELSKASAGGQENGDQESSQSGDKEADPSTIAAQLDEIKAKYDRYSSGRKELLALMAEGKEVPPLRNPKTNKTQASHAGKGVPGETMDHLITPYLEQLLAVSKRQKSLMAQKQHVGHLLSKQNQESGKALAHLAEESQLLQDYPMKGSLRRRSGIRNEIRGEQDLSGRIKPWVFAADSAKMSTLELVAETVDNGQVALEGLMQTLHSLGELTGQESVDETAVGDDTSDVWMPSPQKTPGRTHTGKQAKGKQDNDIWSKLHGNLGLLGQEGP